VSRTSTQAKLASLTIPLLLLPVPPPRFFDFNFCKVVQAVAHREPPRFKV